jgi:hypothetical protein
MEKDNIFCEEYNSLYSFFTTIESRPPTPGMMGQNSSHTNGEMEFYGTNSYEESINLMKNGYKEILPRLISGIADSNKILSKKFTILNKAITKNEVVGFIPNVPNALRSLPDSMINVVKAPIKRKTISITYIMSANCCQDKEIWIKAGIPLLTAIKFIERSGVQIRLFASNFCAESGNQKALCRIKLKDYGIKLDIQKLCFPLAHPSFFRRFGFKWIETLPGINESWSSGYGHSIDGLDQRRDSFKCLHESEEFVLDAQWIESENFEVESILKYLNFQ